MYKKLEFHEKNNFVVKNADVKHYEKDVELFQKHFPHHKLNNDILRANQFTRPRIESNMIYALLEVVSPDEILENRVIKIEQPKPDKAVLIALAKEKLVAVGIEVDNISDEVLEQFANISTEDFENIVKEFAKTLKPAEKIESLEKLKILLSEKEFNIADKSDEFLEKFVGMEVDNILHIFSLMEPAKETSETTANETETTTAENSETENGTETKSETSETNGNENKKVVTAPKPKGNVKKKRKKAKNSR